MNQPAPPPVPKKSWFGRNWKWFLPLGCLGTLVLFAAFVATVVTVAFGVMKSSTAYQDAVAEATGAPLVQQELGAPIEPGFLVSGNVNISGHTGTADLSIPIAGPSGKGTIYVVAGKSAGEWTYSTLIVEIDATGQRIDLLHDQPTEE